MKHREILVLTLLVSVVFACKQPKNQIAINPAYSVRIYQTEVDQFGYEIFRDSMLLIRQPIIPGIAGRYGFFIREDAEKASALMVVKLRNGIAPNLSASELDSLQIRTQ